MTFDTLHRLDDAQIKDIFDNVKNPGGYMANPNAAVAGAPALVRNRGLSISAISQSA